MRRLLFIILLMLWSGLAISLMNENKDDSKGLNHLFKAESSGFKGKDKG